MNPKGGGRGCAAYAAPAHLHQMGLIPFLHTSIPAALQRRLDRPVGSCAPLHPLLKSVTHAVRSFVTHAVRSRPVPPYRLRGCPFYLTAS